MDLESELTGLTVGIVTHVYATGSGDKLETYLKGKTKRLISAGHPFSYCKDEGYSL